MFYNGTWGTVCDNNWDLNDANVVCRQLGFRSAVTAHKTAFFGQGRGEIWLNNVRCAGDENALIECDHDGWGKQDCGHSEDAGVVCTPGNDKIFRYNLNSV